MSARSVLLRTECAALAFIFTMNSAGAANGSRGHHHARGTSSWRSWNANTTLSQPSTVSSIRVIDEALSPPAGH